MRKVYVGPSKVDIWVGQLPYDIMMCCGRRLDKKQYHQKVTSSQASCMSDLRAGGTRTRHHSTMNYESMIAFSKVLPYDMYDRYFLCQWVQTLFERFERFLKIKAESCRRASLRTILIISISNRYVLRYYWDSTRMNTLLLLRMSTHKFDGERRCFSPRKSCAYNMGIYSLLFTLYSVLLCKTL